MTEVITRVHSVHLVNVEQRHAAADPQTKSHDLNCESACFSQLASTTTIAIYYYYSAQKLILIYRPTEGRRLSWPSELGFWQCSTVSHRCQMLQLLHHGYLLWGGRGEGIAFCWNGDVDKVCSNRWRWAWTMKPCKTLLPSHHHQQQQRVSTRRTRSDPSASSHDIRASVSSRSEICFYRPV